jgi:hypothetical protein
MRSSAGNVDKIRKAFAAAGVTFTEGDGRECVCLERRGEG